ncbi:restriction endonuclease [Moorena sp. SIO4G3]|uniref:restriction endonuclease n=1 Tax=Moorena sp. SIO4G3 TaxID=2607821 RepID=UPI0025D89A9C|nr:restriction endonuclease [Moorena sp. SIO4G3]
MDEVVRKVAALGLPGVILLIAMATTGFTGAAAITAALAMLGPFGMLGGIAFLGVVGIAADGLSKFGLEALLLGIYKERQQKGESKGSLCKEIERLMVSRDLKRKLKEEVNNGKSSVEDRRASKSSSFDNIGKNKYKSDKNNNKKGDFIKLYIGVLVKRVSTKTVLKFINEIENSLQVQIESIEDIDEQLDAIDKMTGREFEEFLAKLFKQLGYQVRITKASGDYGADLIITKWNIKTVVQAKRKQSSVGIDAVQQVAAAIPHYQAHRGIVITNSKFTQNAKNLAASNKIELWDRDNFQKVFKKVYKQKPSEDSSL